MHKYVLMVVFSLFLSAESMAWIAPENILYSIRPRADYTVTGMFLNSEYNSLGQYFYREQLSKYEWGNNSYVLVNYPVLDQSWFNENPVQGDVPSWNLQQDESVKITNLWQWKGSSLNHQIGVVQLDTQWVNNPTIYPSFSESYYFPGQCPAFAKIATQDNNGTGRWHAGKNVMERAREVYDAWSQWSSQWGSQWGSYYYDPSWEHRGRMIAFFGWGAWGGNEAIGYWNQYPQGSTSNPGHVGIFLKYAYDSWGYPIGFWIADENYEGDATQWNPDGKIRKHLILVNPPNPVLGHTYANNYFFVDIPVCNGSCY